MRARMILPKLITHYFKHRDDAEFYLMQARDSVRWLEESGVALNSQTSAIDLGCGHGVFGGELIRRGCQVTFADEDKYVLPEFASAPFKKVNLDKDDIAALGRYDLVICSNVLEHLAKPKRFIDSAQDLLTPSGKLYLSWTNWLSLWGGHEFSPFHYLGPRRGHRLYDKFAKRPRKHTPFENLFPTSIGGVLKLVRQNPAIRLRRMVPRYFTEFGFVMRLRGLREFLAWNCVMLIERADAP